jgi:hypothetical protein
MAGLRPARILVKRQALDTNNGGVWIGQNQDFFHIALDI